MIAKMRLVAALSALIAAVVVVCNGTTAVSTAPVELRATGIPLAPAGDISTTIKSPVIEFTNPTPFDPCNDIPIDVINSLGLGFTPPQPQDSLRCQFDAGNYQMAIQPFVWRTYEQTLPPDALEMDIDGHRAAAFWVMKPTDWNNRWWFSCQVAFKTSYGVIEQSLFYSPKYSPDAPDCMTENIMRAHQLAPLYKY